MGWIAAVMQFFKIIGFFLNLAAEKNKKKAADKAAIGKEIVDALAETNKHRRVSELNAVVVKLRK